MATVYNITQITNYDLVDISGTQEQIVIGGNPAETRTVIYKPLSASPKFKNQTVKFGYCCEPKAIQYPIFITVATNNGTEEQAYEVGKHGIFEIQPEEWQNINNQEDPDPKEEIISIVEVRVPWQEVNDPNPAGEFGLKFKFDFVTNN